MSEKEKEPGWQKARDREEENSGAGGAGAGGILQKVSEEREEIL